MKINKCLTPLPGFSLPLAACLVLSAWMPTAAAVPNMPTYALRSKLAHTGIAPAGHVVPKKGYSVVYSFPSSGQNGTGPFNTVLRKAGNLYGTTLSSGPNGFGTVYEVAPDGTETVLYSFSGGNDGAFPWSGRALVMDKSGNLYGTTENGGGTGCSGYGCGTIFEVAPNGTETVLHAFSTNDGDMPLAGVIIGKKSNLYGTTAYDGKNGAGTVYELAADGNYTVLHAFGAGTDGQSPSDGVILDKSGNLYGTTVEGGIHGYGTVYEIAPNGTETVLHSFSNGSDGGYPTGALVEDAAGDLYGTTNGGGIYGSGVVFKIPPGGNETVLYTFTGGEDGANPSSLAMDSAENLYGTAQYGGSNDAGTVFEVAANGTETTLHEFAGGSSDGSWPQDGVAINKSGSVLYGTTTGGGGTGCGGYGCGTVFELRR